MKISILTPLIHRVDRSAIKALTGLFTVTETVVLKYQGSRGTPETVG